jgi:two-component system cell cycle response regulator
VDIERRRLDLELPRVRILAVDDDLPYLKYIRLVLNGAGFDVELALDGTAAIERIRRQPHVDLLLIDLSMPGLDGIETVRLIHQVPQTPPLYTILLTAKDGTDVKLRALDGGLDDFITKMSPESEIIAKIRSAARRLEMERRMHLANEELQSLALTDELTGIANRRALFRAGEEILRSNRQLGVVLFDLDRFKQINDTYGHLAGDHILADIAATFKTHTRFFDLIGRYGGDEFLLLLPDTGVEEARHIADRLIAKIRQLKWSISGTVLTMNAQCGVAGAPAAGSSLPELLAECDRLLYKGKKNGKRNNSGEHQKVNA